MTPLRVAIDYDPALRARDGIARYTRCLVDAMLAIDPTIELFLVASTAVGMPVHPRVRPLVHGMSPRWWRIRLLLAHLVGASVLRDMPPVDVFHATDFVFPPTSDRLPSVVVSLHDVTTVTHARMHSTLHRLVTGAFLEVLRRSTNHILVPTEAGVSLAAVTLGIPRERMTVAPYGVSHQ